MQASTRLTHLGVGGIFDKTNCFIVTLKRAMLALGKAPSRLCVFDPIGSHRPPMRQISKFFAGVKKEEVFATLHRRRVLLYLHKTVFTLCVNSR